MSQFYSDLTQSQVLSDPLINAVMRADRVSRKELELLMTTVATKNFSDEKVSEWRRPLPAFVSAQPLKGSTDLSEQNVPGVRLLTSDKTR